MRFGRTVVTMIDWELARRTGRTLVRPGPEASAAQIAEAVEELRAGAAASERPVREFTDLHASSSTAPVLVVDRPGWISANVDGFRHIMTPLTAKVQQSAGPVSRAVGPKVAGAELGGVLAFLGSKVLGQFDPFWAGADGDVGRLLLVAPNIVEVERTLDVDPHDFRLWVCLHEETHRVQFTAVPWMRDHMQSLVADFIDATDVETSAVAEMFTDALPKIGEIIRGESDLTLSDLFQNERQGEVVDAMTGLMSLLEGHADVVMDGVGPEVVGSVREIRRKFSQRRKGAGALDQLIRRLLGLDKKMRQYSEGADFVRAVNEKVGLSGFNAVWSEPAHLPSSAEIRDPGAWVARVHG